MVGSCNQFAHAAAKAVATSPSRSYNPLFIYGGVGMGKTHLMHAIGRALLENYSGMRIVYTSSERFMNEMIQCISMQRMPQFHQHYRSADVLLVDDIQILGGKERTQEEFFHTFNELYDHQKQIVISSDSSPKDIPGLGGAAAVAFRVGAHGRRSTAGPGNQDGDPRQEGRGRRRKTARGRAHLHRHQDQVNVRELEGALIKLIAYSSVTGTPINLAMAQHCLKHLVHAQERQDHHRVDPDAWSRSTTSCSSAQLKQKTNARRISVPRQMAMYLDQGADRRLSARDRPRLWRQAPHNCPALHPED